MLRLLELVAGFTSLEMIFKQKNICKKFNFKFLDKYSRSFPSGEILNICRYVGYFQDLNFIEIYTIYVWMYIFFFIFDQHMFFLILVLESKENSIVFIYWQQWNNFGERFVYLFKVTPDPYYGSLGTLHTKRFKLANILLKGRVFYFYLGILYC